MAPTSRIGFATRSSRTSFTSAGPVRHGTRCPMWDRLQPVMAQRLVWVGAARTPSPDVRCGHPVLSFAHSMLTSLRHPWLRLPATPAPGVRATPPCASVKRPRAEMQEVQVSAQVPSCVFPFPVANPQVSPASLIARQGFSMVGSAFTKNRQDPGLMQTRPSHESMLPAARPTEDTPHSGIRPWAAELRRPRPGVPWGAGSRRPPLGSSAPRPWRHIAT